MQTPRRLARHLCHRVNQTLSCGRQYRSVDRDATLCVWWGEFGARTSGRCQLPKQARAERPVAPNGLWLVGGSGVSAMRWFRFLGVLMLVMVLGLGWSGPASAVASQERVGQQFVAVAHLDPEIGVLVNVVTGRLMLSGDEVGTPESVLAIEDPLRGHKLFRYCGGSPAFVRRAARAGTRWCLRARLRCGGRRARGAAGTWIGNGRAR